MQQSSCVTCLLSLLGDAGCRAGAAAAAQGNYRSRPQGLSSETLAGSQLRQSGPEFGDGPAELSIAGGPAWAGMAAAPDLMQSRPPQAAQPQSLQRSQLQRPFPS